MKNTMQELIDEGVRLKTLYVNKISDFNKYEKEFFYWIDNCKYVLESIEGKESIKCKNFDAWIKNISIDDEYFDVLIGFLKGMEGYI